MQKIELDIYNTPYLDDSGKFKMEEALNFCGKVGGICYSEEGFLALCREDKEKTDKRIDMTLNSGHHSIFDHVSVSLNFKHLPKIVAMLLNNEGQYTTSEKSARYTVISSETVGITDLQTELYEKWNVILKDLITKEYGDTFKKFKIKKLAMENARYFVSVFCGTEMMYTTTLRQLNYLASWMKAFINAEYKDDFRNKIKPYLIELLEILDEKNLLDQGFLENEKYRSFSLINDSVDKKINYFGDVYSFVYEGSFAQLAQAHRHRTLHYKMMIQPKKTFYVPPILKTNKELVKEWLSDMKLVKDEYPQGEIVTIYEQGRYEDFILKCKERLCSDAQLEIAQTTKANLDTYAKALMTSYSELYEDIQKYQRGARCTFPDFVCKSPCNFKAGILLTRKI